jgi:hypothetical protein
MTTCTTCKRRRADVTRDGVAYCWRCWTWAELQYNLDLVSDPRATRSEEERARRKVRTLTEAYYGLGKRKRGA